MSKGKVNNPLSASSVLENNGLDKILRNGEACQVLGKIRSSPAFWKKENPM
jgi:hypothetical protein